MAAAVALLLCIVATLLLGYRQYGLGDLRTLASKMQAEGRGVVPADLIARAPMVDRARQERLWAIIGNGSGGWVGSMPVLAYGLDARCAAARDIAKRDAETERILTASAGDREAWRKLRQEGPVTISVLGWLAEDLPDPASAGVFKTAQSRIPNLLGVRALATALATEARSAADPRSALADLDALVSAQRPVGSLIDAMILMPTSNIRDLAWLEAASREIDPAPWIDRRDDALAVVGDAFAAERMPFLGGLYQDAVAGRSVSGLLATSAGTSWKEAIEDRASEWAAYFSLPADTAFGLRFSILSEELCRTGIDRSAPLLARLNEPWFRLTHPTTTFSVTYLIESAITAVQADTSARRLRVAGALIHAWQVTGTLPADDAAADFPAKELLAAQRHGPAILYQRLTPTRFRLWTDPATPPTDLVPAGRIDAPKTTTQPWWNHGWCTELDLSAIAPERTR